MKHRVDVSFLEETLKMYENTIDTSWWIFKFMNIQKDYIVPNVNVIHILVIKIIF